MSYDNKLIKTESKKLNMSTFPSFVKFYAKHGKTPQSYIDEKNQMLKDQFIESDIREFMKQEPVLAKRRMLPMPDKSGKLPEEKSTKTVQYYNVDLQKYVTAEVPKKMNVFRHDPLVDDIISSYGGSWGKRGGSSKRVLQKKPKKKVSFKKVSIKKRVSQKKVSQKKPKKKVSIKKVSIKKGVSQKKVSQKKPKKVSRKV
jgi:hypothetical protein